MILFGKPNPLFRDHARVRVPARGHKNSAASVWFHVGGVAEPSRLPRCTVRLLRHALSFAGAMPDLCRILRFERLSPWSGHPSAGSDRTREQQQAGDEAADMRLPGDGGRLRTDRDRADAEHDVDAEPYGENASTRGWRSACNSGSAGTSAAASASPRRNDRKLPRPNAKRIEAAIAPDTAADAPIIGARAHVSKCAAAARDRRTPRKRIERRARTGAPARCRTAAATSC